MTPAVLAIDQGTTSTRTVVIDQRGQVVASSQRPIQLTSPQPAWLECDAQQLYATVQQTIEEALAKVPKGIRVSAVGLTNQRETVVVWDRKTSEPIYPAIVWQCRRTTDKCAELKKAALEQLIRDKTGLCIDPYFSATKLRWLLDNVPQARLAELAFGTIDSWLLWKLSDGLVHATDQTNACRTQLFNIDNCCWDDQLLDLFQIPSHLLAEVYPSGHLFTTLSSGVLRGLPVTAVAGDQQAALFGQLCLEAGQAKNTYGTGGFLVLNTGTRRITSQHGLLTTLACQLPNDDKPRYALEGSVFIAGAAIQWLRDNLQIITDAAETSTIAQKTADCGGVVVVPAFSGLGAPYWNAEARGAIFGLTRSTTRNHVIRATLEAIAQQTADVVEAMTADAELTDRLRVDGGAVANDFLMQHQADLLGITIERPSYHESTVIGIAYLAGIIGGIWSSPSELANHRLIDRLFVPQIDDQQRREHRQTWHETVNRIRW